MSSGITCSNLTSGFIDLATYDEQEKYMYGGRDALAYFVREIRKSTWFTQVPVCLSKGNGTPQFDQEWSVNISRAGDYLLHNWLRLRIPEVRCADPCDCNKTIRWTRNLMHNLVRECSITFNDLTEARFDSWFLDFWSAFTVPAGKRNGYCNMIGTVDELVDPLRIEGNPLGACVLPAMTLNLPLPLPHTRDSGVALPTAALPYNEMRINFSFRDWKELLICDDLVTKTSRCACEADLASVPMLTSVQVWANYAIVSNDERKKMGRCPRDILIEQVQTAPNQVFNPSQNPRPQFDVRFSHSVKALFFGVRNKTNKCEYSNYTAASPVPTECGVNFSPALAADPILEVTVIYENTARLASMGADYFALVNPFYHSVSIPLETGYHMYSYSLDFINLDPMGSTNFGKLTNVIVVLQASPAAITASTAGVNLPEEGAPVPQNYEFIIVAVNNNIVRISGGALGFPVL